MKKNIKVLALIFVLCMAFVFVGCDLFPQNSARYLKQNVITITYNDGKTINITRQEYNNAYSNYGADLVNNNGYSESDAKDSTVKALVNRKILLEEAKNNEEVTQKVEEKKSEILYQTYQALISNANDYEEQVKKALKIEDAETKEKEDEDSKKIYTPYEKQAEVVFDNQTNSYRIKKITSNNDENHGRVFATKEEVKQAFWTETKNNNSSSVLREEYVRYISYLRKIQEALGTNYSDEELLDNEITRIYDNLEENEYIKQYEEVMQYNNGFSTITVDQVLEKYKAMISISNLKYKDDLEKFNKDMLDSFKDVNYYVNDDYFYVAHILIKFSDEEQSTYDSLEEDSNGGKGGVISNEYYKSKKQQLYSNLKATVTDVQTGEVTSSHSVLASDVLKEVQAAVNSASTNEQKDEAFRQLMYKYNEDGGIMNADYSYIIGVNDSRMVENFTNASRELNDAGVYGAVSGLVESQYGLHIIYYMGKCANVVEIGSDGNINLRDNYQITITNDDEKELKQKFGIGTFNYSDIFKLTETKLNNLNNKTLFDLVYESLNSDKYSQFEKINIETLKSEYGIKTVTIGL